MTVPEDPHDRAARLARAYRAREVGREALQQIIADGLPALAHDLTMERYSDDPQYGERVDAFLARAAPNAAP